MGNGYGKIINKSHSKVFVLEGVGYKANIQGRYIGQELRHKVKRKQHKYRFVAESLVGTLEQCFSNFFSHMSKYFLS